MDSQAGRSKNLSNLSDTEFWANASSGRAGLEGLRWLLLGPVPRGVIRSGLGSLVSDPRALGACHLRHARFRLDPDAKLAAYYSTDVRAQNSAEHRSRAIAVMWKPKWIGRSRSIPDVSSLEAEALRRELAPLFHRLSAQIPAWGLHIEVWPLDLSFPQLVRVSDPDYVGTLLARASALSWQWPAGSYRVSTVRYQPGQRHVLRYDSLDRTLQPTVFAKLYRNGEGRRIFEVAKAVADCLAEQQKGVTCLQPLAYVPDEEVIF
jgi:hypothetical protein